MKIYSQTYQAILLIDAPKIHTDVLWDLTILFGSIALVYFAAIFFFRNKISGKSSKKSTLKTELSPMISEFIFYDESGTKEEKSIYINLKVKVRDMLKNDFKRKTIAEILLELRKDVSGAAQQRLFNLFQDLDLHQDSYEKLASWRWERISSGIQELTRMEVNDAYGFLTKFVNDKRTTIRKQAEIAVVTLDNEGINYFLDTTRNRISEWQQLKLIEVLSNKTDFIPPSFKTWLISTNKYVVLFSLRLIKFYDQNDANTSIIELVKHQDNQIKQEAIECIKAFHLTTALPTLKQVFWGCTIDIKIAILDAIANLGSPTEIPFLESIQKKERNYSVTSKALGAINTIVPDSVLPTAGIAKISDVEIPDDIVEDQMVEIHENSAVIAEESIHKASQEIDINTITVEVDEVKNNSSMQKEIDVDEIEVEFSMDFLPLVTKPEAKVKETRNLEETSINDLEVVYEEAYEKYRPDLTSISLTDPKEIEVEVDLEFLPLVVSNILESKNTINLNELDVIFEMVTEPIDKHEEIAINALEVISETLEVKPLEQVIELENIEVVFEEVEPEKVEISFEMDEHLSEHFDFEIIFNNGQPPLRIPKVEQTEVFDFEVNSSEVLMVKTALSEIEVVCEIENGDGKADENEEELPSWLLNEIANESAKFNDREYLKMEGPEWEAKEPQMMGQIQDYIKNIPPSNNSNDDLTDIIQLLDDIELFGDEREIPLLQELMQKEDKAQTKERIEGLMKRFMGTEKYGEGIGDSAVYSVFEELFRNCDTESKLILLDEIAFIGDRKEILFLEQLLNDPEFEIRKKAAASLKLLNDRFERIKSGEEREDADEYERFINMMELNPPKTSEEPSYLQIDFDIDNEENGTKKQTKMAKEEKGFSNFISDFIAKLIKNANFF